MIQITEKSVLQRMEQVPFKEILQEGILLDLVTGDYFAIDEVGLFIWKAMDGKKKLGQIAERIVAQYEVTRTKALSDALAFANGLLKKKLVKFLL